MKLIKLLSLVLLVGGGVAGSSYGIRKFISESDQKHNTKLASIEQAKAFLTSGEWKGDDYDQIPESVFSDKNMTFTEEEYGKMSEHWLKIIPKMPLSFFQLLKTNFDSSREKFYSLELAEIQIDKENSKHTLYLPLIQKSNSNDQRHLGWERIEIQTGHKDSQNKIQIKYDSKHTLESVGKIPVADISNCEKWAAPCTKKETDLITQVYEIYTSIIDRLASLGITQPSPTSDFNNSSWVAKLDPH